MSARRTPTKSAGAQALDRYRDRMRKQGLVRVELLCHPEDREVLRKHAIRLATRRIPAFTTKEG